MLHQFIMQWTAALPRLLDTSAEQARSLFSPRGLTARRSSGRQLLTFQKTHLQPNQEDMRASPAPTGLPCALGQGYFFSLVSGLILLLQLQRAYFLELHWALENHLLPSALSRATSKHPRVRGWTETPRSSEVKGPGRLHQGREESHYSGS